MRNNVVKNVTKIIYIYTYACIHTETTPQKYTILCEVRYYILVCCHVYKVE
jgi:hypothetical protein